MKFIIVNYMDTVEYMDIHIESKNDGSPALFKTVKEAQKYIDFNLNGESEIVEVA